MSIGFVRIDERTLHDDYGCACIALCSKNHVAKCLLNMLKPATLSDMETRPVTRLVDDGLWLLISFTMQMQLHVPHREIFLNAW